MANDLIVDYGKGWRFTQQDLQKGLAVHDYERKLLGVTSPLTPESLYPAFVYSLLSAAQSTVTLVKVFNRLKKEGYLTPAAYNTKTQLSIINILRVLHFPNQKIERYTKFNDWWQDDIIKNDSIIKQIINQSNNGNFTNQHELRKKLATDGCAGVAWKVASFIIQLSIPNTANIQIVVVDKWMLDFLKGLNYKIKGAIIKSPDYRTVSGVSSTEYLQCEKYIADMAHKINLSPSQMGLMVWSKVAHMDIDAQVATEPNEQLAQWCTE